MERLPLLPVEEEGRLHDPALRESFVERIFAYARWKAAVGDGMTRGGLVAFHTAHKLSLLAHSPAAYRRLGALVGKLGRGSIAGPVAEYGAGLMEALRVPATRGRHLNVLQHMLGYFRGQLDEPDRKELEGVVADYGRGLVPLVVPAHPRPPPRPPPPGRLPGRPGLPRSRPQGALPQESRVGSPVPVPTERIRRLNQAPVRPDRAFVLYWMTMSRRTRSNPALERAAELSRELARPVLVLEPLRCAYPYASDRLHAFLVQGMAENARRLAGRAHYLPWLERRRGEGRGLLQALSRQACAVVADDHPGFFLPRMLEAGAAQVDVRMEAVDGACLVPYRLAERDFPTAHAYRRFLQAELPAWLERLPARDPLRRAAPPGRLRLPPEVARRWPAEPLESLERPERLLGELPIDHRVGACERPGGSAAAEGRLAAFVKGPLSRYAEDRSHPDLDGTSGLSPYLHFGHLADVRRRPGGALARGLEPGAAVEERPWRAGRLLGRRRGGRGVPGPARHLARARLRRLRHAAGPRDATPRSRPGPGPRWRSTPAIRGRTATGWRRCGRGGPSTGSGTPPSGSSSPTG